METEDQLRLLHGRSRQQQPTNRVQDDEDVFEYLEDLRETIFDYKVCP